MTDGLYCYTEALDQLLDRVMADQQHHSGSGLSPLDSYVRDLAVARLDAIRMRDHTHVWSLEGYCNICGADGND